MASTGSGRRAFLRAAALAPLGALGQSAASATDYASAAEALDAIDGLEADVEGRLRALLRRRPAASALIASLLADHARLAAERRRLRGRLRLPARARTAASPTETTLPALRDAQQALVYAHAEGLPALEDARAVDLLAAHMVELARHLTVLDLWREAEEARG